MEIIQPRPAYKKVHYFVNTKGAEHGADGKKAGAMCQTARPTRNRRGLPRQGCRPAPRFVSGIAPTRPLWGGRRSKQENPRGIPTGEKKAPRGRGAGTRISCKKRGEAKFPQGGPSRRKTEKIYKTRVLGTAWRRLQVPFWSIRAFCGAAMGARRLRGSGSSPPPRAGGARRRSERRCS